MDSPENSTRAERALQRLVAISQVASALGIWLAPFLNWYLR